MDTLQEDRDNGEKALIPQKADHRVLYHDPGRLIHRWMISHVMRFLC